MVSLPCGNVSRGVFEEAVGNNEVGCSQKLRKAFPFSLRFPFDQAPIQE